MLKTNHISKYLKNLNKSINILLEKNLSRLKFKNLRNLSRNNKVVLTFVALSVIFITYLLIPTFYKQDDISKKLKVELKDKLDLSLQFSKNIRYNFFPKPHFTIKESIIIKDDYEISKINKLKIYVSFNKLFSLKNLQIQDVVIEKANFNINKKNYNFFIQLLENDFTQNYLRIKNSNIFFRNPENEVLFINKIFNMNFFYDPKDLKNIVFMENEIFNIPYEIKLYNDKEKKKISSKINFKFLKLKIENEYNYENDTKIGKATSVLNKLKSTTIYETNKNFFKFEHFDKLDDPRFLYNGKFNLDPFYSSFKGKIEKLNLSNFINSNTFVIALLKTELLNNKNIDFELNIISQSLKNNSNFKNIELNSNIKQGLIDIDKTNFEWRNFADFNIIDSLIFVKNGELVLDGKLHIKINDYSEIYKYLLTPKNYRKELKRIDLNFSYNFDQKSIRLNDIKIDEKYDQNISKIMSNIILKENNLQNRIYLKKIFNDALKSYSG